jgi:hypothetical protein
VTRPIRNPELARYRRVRWAVRATLALGVGASVAANVLHARPNPISQTISAWPPLALLLTVELVSRVPMHRRSLAALRVVAMVVIAGIAAWVSYWHMRDVADRYGETPVSAYLLPVSVDGLIVVASICLIELAGRILTAETVAGAATLEAAPAHHRPSAANAPGSSEDGPVSVLTPAVMVPVAEADDVQVLDVDLIGRARQAAAQHRRRTGRDITRDELRAELRTSNATAGELLRLVRAVPTAVPPARPVDRVATIPLLRGPGR